MNKLNVILFLFIFFLSVDAQDKKQPDSSGKQEQSQSTPQQQQMPVVIPGMENQDNMPMAYIDPTIHYHLRVINNNSMFDPEKPDLKFRLLPDSGKFKLRRDTSLLNPFRLNYP